MKQLVNGMKLENGISIEDEMEFQKLDDNTLTYEVSGVTVHFARD